MDGDANKKNPYTPDRAMSIDEQFLYRFSGLEEAVRSGFRRLDEKVDRLQKDLHEAQLSVNDRISQLDKETTEQFAAKRIRIDGLVKDGAVAKTLIEKRISDIETWQKVIMARFSVALTALVIFWTLFGPIVRNFLGISNG